MRHDTRATAELDAALAEHTEVRPRATSEDAARSPDVCERARDVLARLAPDDPRARLLSVGLLRRDEVLLEAVLRRLEGPTR